MEDKHMPNDDSSADLPEFDQDDVMSIVRSQRSSFHTKRATILRENIQADLENNNPEAASWLSSISGVALQAVIVWLFICISVYEGVFKKTAVKHAKFDYASMVIFQGLFSLVASTSIAWSTGQLRTLFGPHTLKSLVLYTPVGCIFSMTAYLQFVILQYLSLDVFKVLEQSRILVTAVVSFVALRHTQSRAAWCALVVITLCAVSYGEADKAEKATRGDVHRSAADISKNFTLGLMLTAMFVLLQCGASVYCEMILKKDKHLPFFIQKFYLEVPGTLFALFVSWKVDGWMIQAGLGSPPKADDVKFFVDGPFAGWGNPFVILTFAFVVAKSWGSGFLCKKMSSLVKQLCSVVAVCLMYFFGLIHLKCPDQSFFCPENLVPHEGGGMTFAMVVADFCVLASVLSYSFAQQDKQRTDTLSKEVASAKAEALAVQNKV